MEKDVEIKELKDNLSKANCMISFPEQENQQLKVKQLFLEKYEVDVGKEDVKGKEVIDAEDPDENQEQMTRKIPRTRGLKRALQQQRIQMTSVDLITAEINENREFWLEKVNYHLEKLLKRANRDNRLQRHMAMHYYTKNMVSQLIIKWLKEKLKETLIRKKENNKLAFLVDASLIA